MSEDAELTGETAAMHLYFPDRVNAALARTLAPEPTFHPLAYCGDPASFEREESLLTQKSLTGVQANHIPYKGSAAAATASAVTIARI